MGEAPGLATPLLTLTEPIFTEPPLARGFIHWMWDETAWETCMLAWEGMSGSLKDRTKDGLAALTLETQSLVCSEESLHS